MFRLVILCFCSLFTINPDFFWLEHVQICPFFEKILYDEWFSSKFLSSYLQCPSKTSFFEIFKFAVHNNIEVPKRTFFTLQLSHLILFSLSRAYVWNLFKLVIVCFSAKIPKPWNIQHFEATNSIFCLKVFFYTFSKFLKHFKKKI